jgi:hypothetical protein
LAAGVALVVGGGGAVGVGVAPAGVGLGDGTVGVAVGVGVGLVVAVAVVDGGAVAVPEEVVVAAESSGSPIGGQVVAVG